MVENPELCSLLEWDSTFFGVVIGRVNSNRLAVKTTAQILDWCREKKINCLYFLADINHLETLRLAEKNGFYLTDIRMTYEQSIQGLGKPYEPGTNYRLATLEDLPALRGIVDSSYRDSRFYYDGHFPKEDCDLFYETWIENSLSGYAQAVLVVEESGQLGGFVTCHIKKSESKGQIGLFGVSQRARGRGIGQALLFESLHWFVGQGMTFVEVITQGRNIPAQRLYQKCGFILKDIKVWYHRWLKENENPI